MNIEGLYPRKQKDKLRQLSEEALVNNVILLAIAESHLREEVLSAEVEIGGFILHHRVDRANNVKKGGVALYIRKDKAHWFGDPIGESIENTEFLCTFSSKLNLVVCVLYRPGGVIGFLEASDRIADYVNQRAPPLPNILIVGDFNMRHIDWKTGNVAGQDVTGDERRSAERLGGLVEELCLTQIVAAPTRGPNILDLIFTNNTDWIQDCEVEDTNMSDHRILKVGMLMPQTVPDDSHIRDGPFAELNFFAPHIDWGLLSEDIAGVEWQSAPADSVEELYRFTVDKLLDCCTRHVPRKRQRDKNVIPRDRRTLMRKRRRLRQQLSGRSDHDPNAERIRAKIREIDVRLKLSIEAEMIREEKRAVDVIKINPKFFYSYARRKKTSRSAIGPLVREGHLISESIEIAEAFQDHFISVFSRPVFPDVKEALAGWAGPERENEIGNVYLSRERVADSLRKLSDRSAPGPDGVPAVLLRKCADAISSPLHTLWHNSLITGIVPESLKEGLVTPIFKKGNRSEEENYRPVVLTSHIAKTFERIVAEDLVSYLESHGLLSDN